MYNILDKFQGRDGESNRKEMLKAVDAGVDGIRAFVQRIVREQEALNELSAGAKLIRAGYAGKAMTAEEAMRSMIDRASKIVKSKPQGKDGVQVAGQRSLITTADIERVTNPTGLANIRMEFASGGDVSWMLPFLDISGMDGEKDDRIEVTTSRNNGAFSVLGEGANIELVPLSSNTAEAKYTARACMYSIERDVLEKRKVGKIVDMFASALELYMISRATVHYSLLKTAAGTSSAAGTLIDINGSSLATTTETVLKALRSACSSLLDGLSNLGYQNATNDMPILVYGHPDAIELVDEAKKLSVNQNSQDRRLGYNLMSMSTRNHALYPIGMTNQQRYTLYFVTGWDRAVQNGLRTSLRQEGMRTYMQEKIETLSNAMAFAYDMALISANNGQVSAVHLAT